MLDTQSICFDECDLMMEQGEGLEFLTKIKQCVGKGTDLQYVFVAATLAPVKTKKSKSPRALIEKLIPGIETISTDALHSIKEGIAERFVHFESANIEDKVNALLGILYEKSKESVQVLVFVSSPERAKSLVSILEHGMGTYASHGLDLKVDVLHGHLDRLSRSDSIISLSQQAPKQGIHLVISTDITARGVDFQHVDIVVHFDFVKDAAEYIHRVGRVCRPMDKVGGECNILISLTLAFAFIEEKDERLAGYIKDASLGNNRTRLDQHNVFLPPPQSTDTNKIPLTGILSRKRSFSK
jgi:superfamily II DNA/RNA helicase